MPQLAIDFAAREELRELRDVCLHNVTNYRARGEYALGYAHCADRLQRLLDLSRPDTATKPEPTEDQ